MKRRALACALLLAVATAGSAHANTNYNFDYSTDGGNVMGIDRVFDDGQNTVVAFYGPLGAYERPTVTTPTGNVLPYRVVDRYLVLPGLQRHVIVYARGVVAQVIAGRPPAMNFQSAYANATQATAYAPMPTPAVQPNVVTPPAAPAPAYAHHTVRAVAAAPAPVAAAAAPAPAAAPAAEDRFIVSEDAPPPPPKPMWEVGAGESLRNTSERWASRAGWKVYWHLKNGADYETTATSTEGEFLEAMRSLYAPYLQADGQNKPVRVAAYPRQKVIVISE